MLERISKDPLCLRTDEGESPCGKGDFPNDPIDGIYKSLTFHSAGVPRVSGGMLYAFGAVAHVARSFQ